MLKLRPGLRYPNHNPAPVAECQPPGELPFRYTRPTSVNASAPMSIGRMNGNLAIGTRSSAVPYTEASPAYRQRSSVLNDSDPPRNAASKYGKLPHSFFPPPRKASTGFLETGSVKYAAAQPSTDS